jgi:hypothetical protein
MSTNDPTIAFGSLVIEKEEFNVSLKHFIELLWDSTFYTDLLIEKISEKDVVISDWEIKGEESSSSSQYHRTTSSQHLLPVLAIIAWLNLPLYVTSSKTQTAKYDSKFGVFIVTETSSITGIPFLEVDVVLEWRIFEKIDGKCEVSVGVHFIYSTATMIQGLLESISIDEIKKLLLIWIDSARAIIEEKRILSSGSSSIPDSQKKLILILNTVSTTDINSTMEARNVISCLHAKEAKENEDSVLDPPPHLEDRKGEVHVEEKSVFNTWWS